MNNFFKGVSKICPILGAVAIGIDIVKTAIELKEELDKVKKSKKEFQEAIDKQNSMGA